MPLGKLLEEGSGAKGRAQQIALLKEQVKSLESKLEKAKSSGAGASPKGGAQVLSPARLPTRPT